MRIIPLPLFIATLLLFVSFPKGVDAQTATISGVVSDAETGETLIAANIALAERNRGSTTNTAGFYSITGIQPGTYTLVATYVGYRRFTRELTLEPGESRRIDIEMIPEGVQLEEIVVESEAERREARNIGTAQISAQQITDLPSVAEPDLFRSIQLLPGVQAASDFSSGLYIRGGSPDQTLILLDETTVYNPTHFFGFFSTFNPDAVKDVRLYKGGYPAEFGGRLGSVVTVFNKDGNRNRTGGTVSVGLLASRASIEGPYSRGSYMFAVRRSTLEPVLAVLRSATDNVPDSFYFYDINGKINLDASDRHRFHLTFYAGQDELSFPFAEDANIRLDYGNQTGSVQWRYIATDRLFLSTTATASRYFNFPQFQISGTPIERENSVYDFSLKSDLTYQWTSNLTASAGVWGGHLNLQVFDDFDNQNVFQNVIRTGYLNSYIQNTWRPDGLWEVTGGLRLSHFEEGNFTRLEPRLSVDRNVGESVRLQAAYGRYHQFLTLITNEAFTGFDQWLTSSDGVPPAWGDQFVLGAKTQPFEGYGFDVEVYYRTMNDLFELDPFVNSPAGLQYRDLFRFGEGFAYGAEFFFEKERGRLNGFIGYTFGVTRRKFPGFNTDLFSGSTTPRFFPPKFDRQNDLTLVANYRLSSRWTTTAVFNYSTGQAYTEPLGRTEFSNAPFGTATRETFTVGRLNASRLPDYHRLDVAFSREGTFFGFGQAEWQFQIINVYSRRNVWFFDFDFDENPVQRNDVRLLPILPSVSYTLNF
ncbi:MAG: TonB-dependent receptor [Balneolaceae bacterium]